MRRIIIFFATLMSLTVSLAHADPNGGNGGGLGSRTPVTSILTT